MVTCCLNLPSPSSTSLPPPTSSSKLSQVPCYGGGSWRKNCLVGMSCVIMGSEMLMMPSVGMGGEYRASAVEELRKEGGGGVVRWSDKRTCPPWQMNSLEIVVPENLPRPSSARRRTESVGLSPNSSGNSTTVIRLAIRSKGNCFSM